MNKKNKILVTGADGFIGSHLVELLMKEDYEVRALAQYNSYNHWGWLEDVEKLSCLEVITGDIRDLNFCQELTKDIDYVFHLAALIAIPFSYVSPSSYLETNIKGTMNMCQAAKLNNIKRFIHTSTSEVYGTAQYIPIDEKHPLQAQSPYSASKIGADAMAMSFYNSFDLPLTIMRPFNTFGPRQSARAVIPNIISQIASGSKEIKIGDLRPSRDFTFVEDTASAFIALAKNKDIIGEVVNVGSGFDISIHDLLHLIMKLMNKEVEVTEEKRRIRPEKSEVNQLHCDASKIKEYTNYEPEHTLEEGLVKTIEWFLDSENLEKYKPNEYNI
jgi:NAD dependent epimerase/dehydratase